MKLGFLALLQLGLIFGKVFNWTNISWWWVFSPALLSSAIVLLFLIIFISGKK